MTRRSRFPLCALVIGLLLGPSPGWAQNGDDPVAAGTPATYVTPDYLRKLPELPERMRHRAAKRLALPQAIEAVLRQNLQIALSQERVVETVAFRSAANAAFEPLVEMAAGRDRSESPPATVLEGQVGEVLERENDFWSLGIAQRLPTGTELRLDWRNNRSESTLGTRLAPEVFGSSLNLGLVQPLLQGFSFSGRIQRAPVLRAEFASDAAREEARLRAMLTVKATEDAYWDLVQSYKVYEVTRRTFGLAEEQLELTRRQIAAGVLPESDLIGVEGTLAQRQVALVRAETQIERSADLLRGLLNLPAAAWDAPIVPVDAPSFVHVSVPFDLAFDRALVQRPELKRVKIDLSRIALDLEVARNARWPRLDLRGNVGTVGQDTAYAETLEQVRQATGHQWGIGVVFSWAPLGVGTRAEIRRLESVARQNTFDRQGIIVDLRTQIREALRAIETAERQLLASAKFRELAERSLDVEQRRFLNDLSSNFIVAQRQAELAEARLGELEALIQHEKASSDLQLAMGDLLEARHLTFQVRAGG